jgi:hypothetical protein
MMTRTTKAREREMDISPLMAVKPQEIFGAF